MDVYHYDLTGFPKPDELGIDIHRKAVESVRNMRAVMEQQLTWIDEALVGARKTFSSPQIYLIPKTPSTRRTRKMVEIVEDDQSTDDIEPTKVQQKKKKQKMMTRRARALVDAEDTTASSQENSFCVDAEHEVSDSDTSRSRAPVRKTRNRKRGSVVRKATRSRRNMNNTTSEEESKILTSVDRDKAKFDTTDSADAGNETPVSDAGKEMPVSDAEKEMPVSGAGNEMIVSDAGHEMPVSGARNEMIVSDAGNEMPVSDAGNEMPFSDAGNEMPVSYAGNEMSVSSDGNEMPVSSAGSEMPVSSAGNEMPVSSAGNEMPVSSGGNEMPVSSDGSKKPVFAISSSEEVSDAVGSTPPKAATRKRKSAHADQPNHKIHRILVDSAEEEEGFHLLKVKEKASKFEKLVNKNSNSNDHCENTIAYSPRRPEQVSRKLGTPARQSPAVLTRPDAQAAKAAFEKLLGSATKTEPVRRSSRLSTQSKPVENHSAPSLAWTKLQLMKAANTCSKTVTPIPMRTTRSKMRVIMGKHQSEVCREVRKDVISSSEDEFGVSKPATSTASDDDSSDVDRLRLNLPGRTTRSKMRKQLEKENLECQTVKQPAPAKIPRFSRTTSHNRQKPMLANICMMNSFLERNTPTKQTKVDLIKLKRQQLIAKEEESKIRQQRIQEQKQREAEEKRRNREHRQALAAERRREQEKKKQELTEKELRREQEKVISKNKFLAQKQNMERVKHKLREMRLEETRKREIEIQREKQEQIIDQEAERQRQIDNHLRKKLEEQQFYQKQIQENRQRNEDHQQKLEHERWLEAERCRQAQQQQDKERELLLKERQDREKLERLQREKLDIEREDMNNRQRHMEMEREKQMEHHRFKEEMAKRETYNAKEKEKRLLILAKKQNENPKAQPVTNYKTDVKAAEVDKPGNGSELNVTFNKNEENSESYDMTPVRKIYSESCSDENYNIDDIRSDDSTDEDEAPRKKIPSWARGEELKAQLISQYYTPPDLDSIFDVIEMPNLCLMFSKKKPKFFKRTSSAIWNSPMYLPSGKPHLE